MNLESLSTEVRPAPMSSEPLFHADALLAVPLTCRWTPCASDWKTWPTT